MNNTSGIFFGHRPALPGRLIGYDAELAIYSVTLLIGVLGNLLVFVSILTRGRQRLTPNDVFILNLSLSDFLVVVFFIPFNIYIRFVHFKPTVFFCKFTAPVITVALGGVMFTLTVMAIHRWQAIVNPFRREMRFRTACLIVAVIWILCLALAIPKILLAKPVPHLNRCSIYWPSPAYSKAYKVGLFVVRFAIPFSLITFSYLKMGITVMKSQAPRFLADSSGNIRNITNRRENFEVIKTLTVIILLFFVCMFPYRVSLLMRIFGWNKNPYVKNIYQISALLTIFHSCVNPIIYGTLLRRIRGDYLRVASHIFYWLSCRRKGGSRRSSGRSNNAHILEERGDSQSVSYRRGEEKSLALTLMTDPDSHKCADETHNLLVPESKPSQESTNDEDKKNGEVRV